MANNYMENMLNCTYYLYFYTCINAYTHIHTPIYTLGKGVKRYIVKWLKFVALQRMFILFDILNTKFGNGIHVLTHIIKTNKINLKAIQGNINK